MNIDPQSLGNIILALITGIFGLIATRQQVARVREKRAAAFEKAEAERHHRDAVARLELDKIEAEARAETERAKADRAAAESRRIVNESEGELLRKTAEANQMNQMSQLMASQQVMLADVFKQIAVDSARAAVVYDRVAENLSKQTEAIAMVSATVASGHSELKTELEGLNTVVHQAMRDFPNAVTVQVSPLGGQLRQIQETLARLTTLVQGAQITALLVTPSPQHSDSQPLETVTP